MTWLLDVIWNWAPLKNHRTTLASWLLAGIIGYQGLATSEGLISMGINLPDIPEALYALLTAWLIQRATHFAKKHSPAAHG
jgi:hypothetical protein